MYLSETDKKIIRNKNIGMEKTLQPTKSVIHHQQQQNTCFQAVI